MELHHLQLDDLKIAYASAGAGDPVLLVHGGLGDHRIWKEQIPPLARDFTVLAWDAPGGGRSGDPAPNFTMTDYARCLASVIDDAGLGPAHLVGHSFGGALALALHAERPDTVRSLTLVGAYAGWKGSLGEAEAQRRLAAVVQTLDEAREAPGDLFLASLFGRDPDPGMVALVRQVMADTRPAAGATMARAFAVADLTGHLPAIDVPTLIVHGENDIRAPRAVADALLAAIPDARLVVIEDVGHESFLSRLRANSTGCSQSS